MPKPRNNVEVPPAVSSLGYLLEEQELFKNGYNVFNFISYLYNILKLVHFIFSQWKKYCDGRKSADRSKWLNSPNAYQKIEILESGTSDPKKITKVYINIGIYCVIHLLSITSKY